MITGHVTIDLRPLEGLRKTLVSKILKKAVTESVKVVKQTVSSNAMSIKRFGFLAKSIGVKIKTYSEQKTAVAIIGPRSKWSKTVGDKTYRPSYYAHLLEGGTKHSAAKPFLKPALDTTRDQYLSVLSDAIARNITTELNKAK